MNNLIYTIDNNLDISLCDRLIGLFQEKEANNMVFESEIGTRTSNVNKEVRNNTYMRIVNENDEILETILSSAFKTYIKFLKLST